MTEDFNIEDSTKLYFNQIARIPLLTEEEELKLAARAQSGDLDARNKLIECNLRLVISVVKHYHSNSLSFMDLVQEGSIGLAHAVDKFDYTKGNRFSTYAVWWIRQHVSRALGEGIGAIRLPANIVEHYHKLLKIISEYTNQYGVDPSDEELAELTGWDESYISQLKKVNNEAVSLDASIKEDESTTFGEMIPDDKYNPMEALEKEATNKAINIVLDTLAEREKFILVNHLGLCGHKPKTLAEVGEALNITRERVRQLETKALRKMRHPSRAGLLKQIIN